MAGTGNEVLRIWPGDGVPPGAEGWTRTESTMQIPWSTAPRRLTRNVVVPTLTVFEPAPGASNGTAMIVAPGGAFHFLMIDHEGDDMGRWLAGLGVTAFVLKYRLEKTPKDDADLMEFRTQLHKRLGGPKPGDSTPPDRPDMRAIREMAEADGRQAMAFVRANAGKWGIDAGKIGIAGFSAGGGVSLGAAMQFTPESRPNFVAGIYPAYPAYLSVPENAPPLFLVISDDDPQVAALSSAKLYTDWHKAGSKAELHVFGNGGHGYGMLEAGFLSDIWPELLRRWMVERGFLPK